MILIIFHLVHVVTSGSLQLVMKVILKYFQCELCSFFAFYDILFLNDKPDALNCYVHRYFRNADAIMLVYDITSHDSFVEVARRYEHLHSKVCPDAVYMLVGNKCDLAHSRQVPETEGKEYAGKTHAVLVKS